MKYKGIIFDLDGVICFTDKYHYLAWKKVADKIGAYFDEEINNRLRGVSRMESLEIILERYNGTLTDDEKVALATEKNEYYRESLKNITPADLNPDTLKALQTLKADGHLLAVGSSSKNTPYILERLGLDKFFHAVVDGNCINNSKPHPEVFLKAAEAIGLTPNECLVVEDAAAGIEAASAGKFDSAAIGGDAVTRQDKTYEIKQISDLINITK